MALPAGIGGTLAHIGGVRGLGRRIAHARRGSKDARSGAWARASAECAGATRDLRELVATVNAASGDSGPAHRRHAGAHRSGGAFADQDWKLACRASTSEGTMAR